VAPKQAVWEKKSISQTVMTGYSLSLVTTGDGVVTQHITVVVAGWALTSLREHWNPKPVLDRYHKLKHKIYYRKLAMATTKT
jgi:hypothetical protein